MQINNKSRASDEDILSKLKKLEKKGSHIGSKWSKTKALSTNQELNKYIPLTKKLSQEMLASMLDKFKMVYLKPVKGTYGDGVMRAEKQEAGDKVIFQYQKGTIKKSFKSFSAFYSSILNHKRKRNYLVQQGIHLLKYKERLFDLRIMVQKNTAGHWTSTGIIGRVANPSKIITNYHGGGTPMAVKRILIPHMTEENYDRYHKSLIHFGQYIAEVLSMKYPNLNMIGVDVGIDTHLYPWIIEVNTNPDPYIFKKLKNKVIFNKVYRYAKRLKRA